MVQSKADKWVVKKVVCLASTMVDEKVESMGTLMAVRTAMTRAE